MPPIEKHVKGDPELMGGLNTDFTMHKKSDCDNNKTRRISKTSKGGCDHNAHWALFIWIMRKEMKAIRIDETALKWAMKAMNVFNHVSTMPTMHQCIPKFALGGDRTAEEGKPLMHVRDMLTDEDTFTIIGHSMEEVAKIKALHTPETMKACFGNEECTKRVIVPCSVMAALAEWKPPDWALRVRARSSQWCLKCSLKLASACSLTRRLRHSQQPVAKTPVFSITSRSVPTTSPSGMGSPAVAAKS
jgi:hypothetical protein